MDEAQLLDCLAEGVTVRNTRLDGSTWQGALESSFCMGLIH